MPISEKIEVRDIHYARHRLRNRVYVRLLTFLTNEARKRGLTRRDFAVALDKDPAQITRWLSRPTNLTLDTIADLLNVVEADVEVSFGLLADQPKSNHVHPLMAPSAALRSNLANAVQRLASPVQTATQTPIQLKLEPANG